MVKREKIEKRATVKDYGILIAPLITEKASQLENGVAFRVYKGATKGEIKAAVERAFNVSVKKVRTISLMGKPKRALRSVGRRAGSKKAYVTLAEGQKIDIVEGL